MSENLPDWAVIGAEVLFVSSPTGMGRDTVTKAVITKITPTGQIATSATSARDAQRFKPRDYNEREGCFSRWLSDGRMSYGSIRLYPANHPQVPLMLAQRDEYRADSNVRGSIRKWEKDRTPLAARALRTALEVWERAVQNIEDLRS